MPVTVNFQIFKDGALVGKREFSREIIRIGRLASAHLCLTDEKVSRIHSVIEVASEGLVNIVDMGSESGTFVNGKSVSKGTLHPGDEIRLGDTRLIFGLGVVNAVEAGADPPPSIPTAIAPVEGALLAIAVEPPTIEVAVAATSIPLDPPVLPGEPGPDHPVPFPREPRHSATPFEPGEDGIEVRVFWSETLLGSLLRRSPKEITLGETAQSDFELPGQDLPFDRFPIVEMHHQGPRLVFAEGMEGEFERPGEGPRRLQDLARIGADAPHDRLFGCRVIPLPGGAFAWVQLKTLRVEVSRRAAPKRAVAPFWTDLDFTYLNTLLLFAFLVVGVVITAATTPLDTDTTGDDLFRNPATMAKFIVQPPIKTKNPWVERLKGASAKASPGERRKGADASVRKSTQARSTRSASKAAEPSARDVVKNSGLIRLLGGGGLSAILGRGGLDGDLKGAMGHMFGPSLGGAQGLGGLVLRGTGNGGGMGNSIGIGDIGTKGRGGGEGGYGSAIGSLGRKMATEIPISSGNPIVEGSLDKDLIRRVIHAHRSQIRFCYESELVRHPGLGGKVSVKFIISSGGTVRRAGVDTSTLGNANVENCIVSRVYQWQFPKPKGGGIVVVNYPFLLKESGE